MEGMGGKRKGEMEGGERGGRREGGGRKASEGWEARRKERRKREQEGRVEGRKTGKNSVRQDPRNSCALNQISVTIGIFCVWFIHIHIHSSIFFSTVSKESTGISYAFPLSTWAYT